MDHPRVAGGMAVLSSSQELDLVEPLIQKLYSARLTSRFGGALQISPNFYTSYVHISGLAVGCPQQWRLRLDPLWLGDRIWCAYALRLFVVQIIKFPFLGPSMPPAKTKNLTTLT